MTSTVSGVEQRPNFYEHQYLEAADLEAVVAYARAQLSRAQLGGHRWGIALGLDLREVPGPGATLDVFVQPGYAWDGFGRAIVVPAPHRLPGSLFAAIDTEFVPGNPPRLVEVWIRYTETATKGPRPGFEECEGGPAFARVLESYAVEVGRRATLDAQRDPILVAGRSIDASQALLAFDPAASELDDASVPQQDFPEDGTTRWLVPIGMVMWEPGAPGKFVARDTAALDRHVRARQYAGVVGGSIEATGGYVRVHDRAANYSPFFTADDLLWVEGALRVDGDARLYGPGTKLEFVRSHTEAPRQPFQLLRRDDATGVKLQAVIGEENSGANRLAVGRKTGVDAGTGLDLHSEAFVVTDTDRVGIGTSTPMAPLHVGADGIEIGTSADPTDNFYVQANADGPRGLRVYNGDMGAGTHVASFTQNGRLGIGTTDPAHLLHVNGDLGIRQNRLYLSGGANNWASVSFNAHRTADGANWRFPDNNVPAVTIEMDAAFGGPPRFEVYSTITGDNEAWRSRLRVDGHSGNIGMALVEGSVGIGTYSPGAKLDVRGEILFSSNLRPVGATNATRLMWGLVNANGSLNNGTGFTVTKLDTGRYQVVFSLPFPSPPAVIVTKVWASFEFDAGNTVDARQNAIVDQVNTGLVIIDTADEDGVLTDSNFCFCAIGSR